MGVIIGLRRAAVEHSAEQGHGVHHYVQRVHQEVDPGQRGAQLRQNQEQVHHRKAPSHRLLTTQTLQDRHLRHRQTLRILQKLLTDHPKPAVEEHERNQQKIQSHPLASHQWIHHKNRSRSSQAHQRSCPTKHVDRDSSEPFKRIRKGHPAEQQRNVAIRWRQLVRQVHVANQDTVQERLQVYNEQQRHKEVQGHRLERQHLLEIQVIIIHGL